MSDFDLDKVFIRTDAHDVTRILVDSGAREVNADTNDWAEYVADLAFSKGVPPIGFMIDPQKGMYMIVSNTYKELYPALEHEYHFDLFDYIKTTKIDFWLCVYDKENTGKITQHVILYTRREPVS